MSRNIILCSDGTCNAFKGKHSNVAKLLQLITLNAPDSQIVIYDQGIGTRMREFRNIEEWRTKLLSSGEAHKDAFYLLPPPNYGWFIPIAMYKHFKAMTFGDGLEVNVKQLYIKLAEIYETGDKLFFFGFSRGAFTVRALAGLLWRYGLPSYLGRGKAGDLFDSAWSLFSSEFPDDDGKNRSKALAFREKHNTRDCPINFLGLWDTVKSYGGIKPIMLPHLRHNPSVTFIRHALALDEERGWFDITQWGWLDSDRKDNCKETAVARLDPADRAVIEFRQDIKEVWFVGAHSDIGGDNNNRETSDIALRWMLGEGRINDLILNSEGEHFLSIPVEQERPIAQSSRSFFWKLVDLIPRYAIDNSGKWPIHRKTWGAAERKPQERLREREILMHESVPNERRFSFAQIYPTCRLAARKNTHSETSNEL